MSSSQTSSSHRVEFPNAAGQLLAGRLELPQGPARAYALLAHCFTCGKDLAAASRLARALAADGYAVLRFDFTGLGGSEGDFANTNFSSNVDDLVAAADWLREHHAAPRLLVGHSLGGAAVLMAARRIPESVAVATLAAPSQPGHLAQLLGPQTAGLGDGDEVPVSLGGRSFPIRRQFMDDLRQHDLAADVGQLGRALLVLHSPSDTIVDIEHGRRLFDAAQQPKSFVSLDGADHLLSRKQDSEYVAAVLAAWAGRYVPESRPGAAAQQAARQDDGSVYVEELAGLTQRIVVGQHVLLADEPASVGGANRGPTPYGLLLAGLGACTSMTLRMYATRKGWPLEQVAVSLRHQRVHAQDCAECEDNGGFIDHFERDIELSGPLDEQQRARLAEIAERCPVHRTLENQKRIVTRLVPEG